jgi:hypothetical protein
MGPAYRAGNGSVSTCPLTQFRLHGRYGLSMALPKENGAYACAGEHAKNI